MTTATGLLDLPELVQVLHEAAPPQGRVLSVYLDTSPERMRGEGYLLRFRDGCRRLRGQLAPVELERFEAAAAQAEGYLMDAYVQNDKGLALFAGGDRDYFYTVPMPKAPEELVIWDDRPVLAPLREVLDDYERAAVLLFDKERARLFTIFFGEIEHQRTIEDVVPGKQATGEWFGLAQARFARHHEDHVLRHAKRAIALLMEELRARPFDRLLLGGPDEAIALLKPHLPAPLRARLAGTIQMELFANDAAVLEKALAAMEALERAGEREQVQELLDAAVTPHAVVGPEASLEALGEGRVHRLLITGGAGAAGSACQVCGRLLTGGDRCSTCGGHTAPVDDLRERIVAQAADQGASIEFVSGEAAELLMGHGGLGAWTRY